MSRGNHESENMNKMYGFEGEVKSKYSANMADLFTEVYNWLPLAYILRKDKFNTNLELEDSDDSNIFKIYYFKVRTFFKLRKCIP